MTDATGNVVWAADYKPFGEATITVSTITNNLRFPGQYFDAETGLLQNGYRDYNFSLGRYVEADRIGILEGENHLYVYTGNDPINDADPLGLNSVHFLPSWIPTGNSVYPNWVVTFNNFGLPINLSRGSINPDPNRQACQPRGCPTIQSGYNYTYNQGLFPNNPRPGQSRYPALFLGTVPSIAPNPNNNNLSLITGAWIHRGGQNGTGSQGCLTISPNNWNNFISNFPQNSSGRVLVW